MEMESEREREMGEKREDKLEGIPVCVRECAHRGRGKDATTTLVAVVVMVMKKMGEKREGI